MIYRNSSFREDWICVWFKSSRFEPGNCTSGRVRLNLQFRPEQLHRAPSRGTSGTPTSTTPSFITPMSKGKHQKGRQIRTGRIDFNSSQVFQSHHQWNGTRVCTSKPSNQLTLTGNGDTKRLGVRRLVYQLIHSQKNFQRNLRVC
jgi:hypothetical protein